MIEVNHQCGDCARDADECYCDKHLKEILKEAFDEGFEEGKKYVIEERL